MARLGVDRAREKARGRPSLTRVCVGARKREKTRRDRATFACNSLRREAAEERETALSGDWWTSSSGLSANTPDIGRGSKGYQYIK